MRRFIQQLIVSLSLLGIVRRYKNKVSLMKINAAKVYVLGVKKARLFFLGILFVFVGLGILVNGISLIQTAFFTYSNWSNEMKFTVALIMGGIEFLGSIGVLIYLFREETWGHFTEVRKVVNLVIEKESDEKKEMIR
jgi:cytochrome c biogenesis protein CcdA